MAEAEHGLLYTFRKIAIAARVFRRTARWPTCGIEGWYAERAGVQSGKQFAEV